ncbi:Hypothetical predicted protein [Mytilus galloprovincialis]|uniref:Apple domain-containing protein n=1 Tax=Mytilus galloprovincialis TaxID=29158 RepID=A0A8B6H5D7_MYTGA|nr:Hypothetical predicted protein [Mytilus galloprovincialis]
MNTRPHTIVWIILLVFSWKCGKVSGSETSLKTWKEAVLDCYRNNSFLESNITVLQNYMVNHTTANSSIWVGGFKALLPWIEIRGCYNLPLSCNSFETDEKNAASSQLCQLKCMDRRYFAFNQQNERCVCFDEHDLVKKPTDNASFCHECIGSEDCTTYYVVYKGDGRITDPAYQHFFQYRGTCEEKHFTYPLLYSENLCNVSESLILGIDVWVGVYRQTLYMENLDNADTQIDNQEEPINTTSNPMCQSEGKTRLM